MATYKIVPFFIRVKHLLSHDFSSTEVMLINRLATLWSIIQATYFQENHKNFV